MGPQPHSCGRTQGVLLFNTGVGADVLDGPHRLLLVERAWALPCIHARTFKNLRNTDVGADVLDGPRRLLLVERTWALPVTTPRIIKQETLYDIKFSIIASRRNELWH